VRLTSRDGGYIELWPEAYQLDAPVPDLLDGEAGDDWLLTVVVSVPSMATSGASFSPV